MTTAVQKPGSVMAEDIVYRDPAFRHLLRRRSRLRWGLTLPLVTAYFSYGLAGIYFPDAMASRVSGTPLSFAVIIGYAILFASIGLSLLYVYWVGRMRYVPPNSTDSDD